MRSIRSIGMQPIRTLPLVAVVAVLLTVAACSGGEGGGGDGGSLSATHAISGIVGGATAAGVTLTLGSGSTATTTTDASGGYRFTGLADGRYTVTPSKAGYEFSPASLDVTLSGADVAGQSFTASAAVSPRGACSAGGWCWLNPDGSPHFRVGRCAGRIQ